MPSSVLGVNQAAGLEPDGLVRWGEPVPFDESGIYVVSTVEDISAVGALPRSAPVDLDAVKQLLSTRQELTVDGGRPSPSELASRLSEFWLPDENILYIGLATELRSRVRQFYRTPLGARRPHAGGWFLKTVSGIDQLYVHWTSVPDRNGAESAAIGHFVGNVSAESLGLLRDPVRPLPFANLEWPPGTRKNHGIRRATEQASKSTRTKAELKLGTKERDRRPPEASGKVPLGMRQQKLNGLPQRISLEDASGFHALRSACCPRLRAKSASYLGGRA